MTRFILHLPDNDLIQRAHLLTRITRVILFIASVGGLALLSGVFDLQAADRVAVILILLTLIPTGICTFTSQQRGAFQIGAFCFIVGFSLAISLAVFQFGRRIPEVHLGYFIPIAIAAIFWGSRLGFFAAFGVWVVNVLIVAYQPESSGIAQSPNEIIGLLTLGASYLADAFVVGRFAENLAHALSRTQEKAAQAARAEKHAVESARELATLYALASRLAATLKLEDFIPLTTKSLVESLQVTHAAMLLIEKDELFVASCDPCRATESPLEIGRREQLIHLPIVQRALERRECETIQSRERATIAETEAEFLNLASISSLAIVPVHLADKPLGVFVLGEARAWERAPLDEEKLKLARSIADLTAGAIERSRLFDELEDAYVQTVLALAKAVEAKDTYTADHAERLADQAERVARKLGMNDSAELRALRFGAMLHDVGKIGVPDSILKKPGPLDADEWQVMRQHPAMGSRILETVARLKDAARVVRHHHERWDGKGYPDGLRGDAIPLGARILTVVDSYGAITDARTYKTARSHSEAVAELERGAGAQFDPRVVQVFLEIASKEPTQKMLPEISDVTTGMAMPELEVFRRMAKAVSGSLNLNQVLEQAARTTVETLGAAAAGIFLYRPEDDTLTLAAEMNLPATIRSKFARFDVKGFHNESVVRNKRLRLHGSPKEIPEFMELEIPQQQPEWGNYLCVPLLAKGNVAGVLGVFARRPRNFDSRDLAVYTAIGEQIGFAIANAQLHESVQFLAITDGLTGAFNRRYLDEILAKELAHCARYPRGVSLIMLDMDHFKAYNDVNGHLAGDEALRRAAQIIHENVRVSDVPARYGGEEFAIVLPDTDQVGAFAAAEKIREAIAAQNFSAGTLTASLGVTTCVADDRASPDDVIARADQALYQAKNSGRNRVCVWNSAFAGSPSHHPNIPAAHNENSLDTDKH